MKAIVTADVYSWHEKSGDITTPLHTASKGDEIDVTEAEFKRGNELHKADGFGLVKPKSKDAKEAKTEAEQEAEADAAAAPAEA